MKPFRKAAVLGAGVMGCQIAAHLANAGLTVYLLELPSKGNNKNELVETAFNKALKQSPPIFYSDKIAKQITLGNYEEDFDKLKEVDWVIEAIVENLAIKQQLLKKVEDTVNRDTVISTNTSGLSIKAIAEGLSQPFRQRFLGTHFFNPPRYQKLLELIPTEDTKPEILKRMEWFGRMHLGKGIVIAKDTPNFIANRIGIFVSMLGIKAFTQGNYTIEEIDTLTGTLIGRPKSATFRTVDLIGLDTFKYVTENLYPTISHDEQQKMFKVPTLINKLVETGTLGAKTRQGFYKKVDGEILSLNPKTFSYEAAKPLNIGNLDKIKKTPNLKERLQKLYHHKSRGGEFFRESILQTLAYSANRIPEIADNPIDIDKAMRWGFGWEIGPFEIWDALGWETVLADMEKMGLLIPDWVKLMRKRDVTSFYLNQQRIYVPTKGYISIQVAKDELHLRDIESDFYATLWHNSEAALLDIGNKVALYQFRSKANTLSLKVIDGLFEALDWLENHDYKGMVIGNEGVNFCVGINLAEIGKIAQWENINPFSHSHTGIDKIIHKFQSLIQRIHYFHKPIVAAIQGRVLGGGCELAMACPHVVADAETYIGLVELGVGLIPAGGGLMRMAKWASNRAATQSLGDVMPFLKQVFTTIGMGKVAKSAYEAQDLGFLSPTTKVVMNSSRRLYVAKQEVICLANLGYTPPAYHPIFVLGKPAQATLECMAYLMQQGNYISEYDRLLANRLAFVLTGGELTHPSEVDEEYLLQLERDNFLPLVDEVKTKERILHMLKTKKPLRN